jgi:O-6-methylguanine DNA methyltransferase
LIPLFPKEVAPINSYLKTELDAYFKGDLKKFTQKVKFTFGTPFEQRIWRTLQKISYGETRSYKWIAERAGSPGAMRAAGQALGKNPLPLIFPCHRIIAADGSIGGFSSGIAIKRWLLGHEMQNRS